MRVLLTLVLCLTAAEAQRLEDLRTRGPLAEGDTLVIGFLGSWERWDDSDRGVRQLILRLRGTPGLHAESIGNHQREVGLQLALRAFDRDGDGRVDAGEGARARLILFGHSLGGAAAVKLARELGERGVPVLLTVQVDSFGFGDDLIPPNVAAAANFYQRGRLTIRGEREVRAQDPSKTAILYNREWRDHYAHLLMPGQRFRRLMGGGHGRMELDPALWGQVEAEIRAAIERKKLEFPLAFPGGCDKVSQTP